MRSDNSNDVIIGSAKVCGVKAVAHNQKHGNKTCTGLFVTRIRPGCTARDLELHVWNTTGYRVKPEMLQTKYDSYKSFYVRCDHAVRSMLFDPSIWPEGSMVKLFYSRY